MEEEGNPKSPFGGRENNRNLKTRNTVYLGREHKVNGDTLYHSVVAGSVFRLDEHFTQERSPSKPTLFDCIKTNPNVCSSVTVSIDLHVMLPT